MEGTSGLMNFLKTVSSLKSRRHPDQPVLSTKTRGLLEGWGVGIDEKFGGESLLGGSVKTQLRDR